ncbi:MAG TPA: hypothetical protein VMR16_00670 [Candidatus Saccharimonadales bacterium]|nr:hypothetical protein [Candidatus Saccharimonadales bacterium]
MTELLTKKVETNTEKNKPYRKYLVGAVAVFAALFVYHEATKLKPNDQNTESNTPVAQEQPNKCGSTWEMPGISHGNGDWVEGGIPEIKDSTNREARDVFNDWFDKIDNDNELLSYISTTIHASSESSDQKVIDKSMLVDNKGCASDAASQEVSFVKEEMKSANITFEDAPTDGRNSHVEDDIVIKAADAKIEGDRKAIKIAFPNGNDLWILGICGNLVTEETPKVTIETHNTSTIVKRKTIVIENRKEEKKTIVEKSSNTNDYKQPGNGSEKDSGNWTKDKVTISTPAESTPPKVEVKNDKVGSQTDTKAPESSPSPSTNNKQNEGNSNNGSVTD